MKILFYFGGFAPVGGIETFGKNLLSHLQSRDHSCTLLCWGQMSPLLESIKQATVPILRSPWRWGCRFNLPDWVLLLIGIQQIKQADLVLFGKLFPLDILKRLRLQAGETTRFVYITPYKPLQPTISIDKRYILEALNLFDMILVQSSSFIDDLHNIGYLGRSEVIPYIPHNPGNLKPLPSQEKLKIGFLGRLVEDKNVPLLIESFRCFLDIYLRELNREGKKNFEPSLHLFGDGHLRQELEQLTQNLGIASSIIFHGSVPHSQVEEAIASCHLFAFTSRWEGQCLAALEILACGRPIVATDAGALPEILSDSRLGKLVPSANPENFASSLTDLVKLIHQHSISPETVRSAYLERYEPTQIGDRYRNLLISLCN
ncbi:MAG: glycosyltransferase [Symplocastrum torsivum CPER-KK1]|jgi:glycosyltransferase involved in cell wall biosynthesis|uniref:Glycosyltransferase n=1 Tax=Symplocastrum torsivum CPER-KK1 TaxID=450513 RepID=A0A951UAY4_9CYAN|nr:glycosyltransferase [Symplocastrum torsivum CPER-KK1]